MFFTRIGLVLAYLGFSVGLFRTGLSFFIAFTTESMEANIAFSKRYLVAANTGEAIGEGATFILVSVALGILCEISRRAQASGNY